MIDGVGKKLRLCLGACEPFQQARDPAVERHQAHGQMGADSTDGVRGNAGAERYQAGMILLDAAMIGEQAGLAPQSSNDQSEEGTQEDVAVNV